MDREITQSDRRSRQLRSTLKAIGAGIVLLAGFFALRAAITPSVALADLRTATVRRGPMVAAIDVSGVIVPRHETVVSSAFASEVREILATPGRAVEAGDPIVRIEHRPLAVEISQLQEQLALKENARRTRRLELDQSLSESEGRKELLEIDLEGRRARRSRLAQLAGIGAISKGELEEADLDVRRTEVELAQLSRSIENQRKSHAAELEKIDLEAKILRQQLAEKERLRELATIRAPHDGVVTWVLEEPGASFGLGAPLARVADLSAYRVEATVSDYYATDVTEGQPASIRAAGQEIPARVASVLPAVQKGSIRVLLDLRDADAEGLRPQLRAEVRLITDQAADTLFVKRGPGISGRGDAEVFRIAGREAIRSQVTLGFSNQNQVQVLEGLDAGDRIIVSNMNEYNHLEAIKLEGVE